MVSLIASGRPHDDRGRPYRRRRIQPWLVLVAVLTLAASVVWVMALTKSNTNVVAMACNDPAPVQPPPGTPAQVPLGKRMGTSLLQDVEPAALSATKVRVFNANGHRGQAGVVAAKISDLGFASAADVQIGNDPTYLDQNMQCSSQIRFGGSGRNAASAVQLIAPCSELIEDNRADDSVDLALGTYFTDVHPNADAQEVLRSLKDPAPGVRPAPLDINLLAAARKARC